MDICHKYRTYMVQKCEKVLRVYFWTHLANICKMDIFSYF